MSKNIFFILIGIGVVGSMILYFQNIINPVTLNSPFGKKTGASIILYSTILGIMIGFGVSGILSNKNSQIEDDEGF